MRLPPLNAVRAFDAVARLGSVRAAAEELAVTPAAVSQQLRVLEAHLGIALTQRHGRGLALTDPGRTWHGEIARHLRAIALAAERVRPGRRVVQVTVVQSFGSRWLMPRLASFTARAPEIEVRIDASPVLADLARDPFDLAIREGRGVYPDAESVRLFPLEFVPVASPAVARAVEAPQRHDRLVARPAAARGELRLLARLDRGGRRDRRRRRARALLQPHDAGARRRMRRPGRRAGAAVPRRPRTRARRA